MHAINSDSVVLIKQVRRAARRPLGARSAAVLTARARSRSRATSAQHRLQNQPDADEFVSIGGKAKLEKLIEKAGGSVISKVTNHVSRPARETRCAI